MHRIIVIILLAVGASAQALIEELNVDKQMSELANRALEARSLHWADLENTVLGKPGSPGLLCGDRYNLGTPRAPRRIPYTFRVHSRTGCENAAEKAGPFLSDWRDFRRQMVSSGREIQEVIANTLRPTALELNRTISLVMFSLVMGLGILGPSPLTVEMALANPAAVVQMAEAGPSEAVQRSRIGQPLVTSTASSSRQYTLITGFPFPLGPFFERKTVETELVKDRVYSFEQEIRLSGISANVRSTVFRMRDNHLLVYNPVAPTKEFLNQLKSLNSNGVRHILLGSAQYEHKVFVGPFAREFPDAKVWTVPDQYSYPINLPQSFYGIDVERSGGGELLNTAQGSAAYSKAGDLTDEFEVKLLRPKGRIGSSVGLGYAANEAALFHKDTKTLVVTDALINVPARPTPIYEERLLLAIGDNRRDSNSVGNLVLNGLAAVNWQGTGNQEVKSLFSDANAQGSTSDQLQRGWERNALLSLYFGPSPTSVINPAVSSFPRLAGKWSVAPVTDGLIYKSERVKPELKRWIDDITTWDFKLISPSHFDVQPGTPDDVRAAFASSELASADLKPVSSNVQGSVSRDRRLIDTIYGLLQRFY